jgi:hypothetical protein
LPRTSTLQQQVLTNDSNSGSDSRLLPGSLGMPMLVALDSRPILVRVDRIAKLLTKRLVALRSHRARSGIHHIGRLVAEGLAGLGLDLRLELVDGTLTGGRGGATRRTIDVSSRYDRRTMRVETNSEILPVRV